MYEDWSARKMEKTVNTVMALQTQESDASAMARGYRPLHPVTVNIQTQHQSSTRCNMTVAHKAGPM